MNILQIKASDPDSSAWVSASAGTGKTKILTDRVLRLLIQGVAFNKILCLTFTNNAASEMQERIISCLQKWSCFTFSDLKLNLTSILGREATYDEVKKASSLFKLYLNTQDQINIYTVHSFCQKILKKFPLEAEISPNFRTIDEFKVKQIVSEIKKQIYNLPELQSIIDFLAKNFHELTIDNIFMDILSLKEKFLERKINLSEINEDLISFVPKYLKKLQSHDPAIYGDIIDSLEIKKFFINFYEGELLSKVNLKNFFLTSTGERKKRIVTKKIAAPDSDLYKNLATLQDKIYQIDQNKKSKYLILYSKLLTILAKKFISLFEIYKKENAFLDYDDLIICARNLLTNSEAKEWVLYKLDGGIEHLLVDEAQDTSKSQWSIIEALIEEFYAGESSNVKNRTIFVVGDEKQSIFSFQGADISSFLYMNKFLSTKLIEGNKNFKNIDLDISYRSTDEIITYVNNVFSKIAANNPEDFHAKIQNVTAYRKNQEGRVELWPLCANKNSDISDKFWSPEHGSNLNDSKILLAKKIANYVKEQIDSERILPSTNKKISAKDFMILFRSRDDFTDEVIKSLQQAKVEITGLDRILLAEDLKIMDIISILNFVLDTEDNLNLASLLKSQIISVSEDLLYEIVIAARDKKLSIWKYLNSKEKYFVITNQLIEFLALYENLPLSNFFLYIIDILNYRNIINYNDEIINEFLKLVQNYLFEYGDSLQNFIHWFATQEIIIKKDTNSSGKLRIMTAHASKGLQAPIVILCDTTKLPTPLERFVWNQTGQLLSAKSSYYVPEYYKKLKVKEYKRAYQEYLRLLYVAMTRAEDNLIICGYQGRNSLPEGCWYQLAKNSMLEIGSLDEGNNLVYGKNIENKGEEKKSQKQNQKTSLEEKNEILFSNINQIYKKRSIFQKYITKAKDDDETKEMTSNNDRNENLALQYGVIFHKVLEDSVNSKVIDNITDHPLIKTLEANLQKKMKNSIDKLINNCQFQELLRHTVKTEISFGYKVGAEIKTGRVDLLVIKKNEIIIIDYKSDNKPNMKSVSSNYIKQLELYRKAFSKIYPEKKIKCQIIWLENGTVQNVCA